MLRRNEIVNGVNTTTPIFFLRFSVCQEVCIHNQDNSTYMSIGRLRAGARVPWLVVQYNSLQKRTSHWTCNSEGL